MTQDEPAKSTKTAARPFETKNDKRKFKKKDNLSELMTRVIIRQLPPTMTEQHFLEDVSPLPEYTDFYYVNGDLSLGEFAFSRAYFKFFNFEELLIFKDKFDDYVFMDSKGNEYPAVVEFAPLQKMPRRSGDIKQTRVDTKTNTIESDPDYMAFVEELKNSNSPSPPPYSADTLLEEIENRDVKENDSKLTPLLEYLSKKREEKQKFKDEKKRKKDDAKKKKTEEKKIPIKEKENKPNIIVNKEQPQPPPSHIKRRQAKSPDKKEKEKKPKQDATYVIKVNTDEHKAICEKPKTGGKLGGQGVSGEKEAKPGVASSKEQKAAPRIRNKDRPAREIYRPGAKPKSQAQAQQTPAPTSCDNIPPSSSDNNQAPSTSAAAKPASKFKNRVFTRTAKH